jgi:hypothetical protein
MMEHLTFRRDSISHPPVGHGGMGGAADKARVPGHDGKGCFLPLIMGQVMHNLKPRGLASFWSLLLISYLACKVFWQLIIHFPTISGPFLPARDDCLLDRFFRRSPTSSIYYHFRRYWAVLTHIRR